ncbi:MAG: hypothetical protein D6705_10785 [Deltaproteobacteria bacterium]|nr:MAG: hypothetical protein D6705_10785 [Deltaproteobacteria bacterium]
MTEPRSKARYEDDPARLDDGPTLAYGRLGKVLAGAFFAYHALILIVYNLPHRPPTRMVRTLAARHFGMDGYMRTLGLTQGWGMFAPNPHRSNAFLRVYVEDRDGTLHDARHDVYLRRRYPYLFYDRLAKVNRRLIESKGYRQAYAAFVCRSWALAHDGVPPRKVIFEKLWTLVPPPEKVYRTMGYHPRQLHLHRRTEETFVCDHIVHGQLPPELLERHGLSGEGSPPFRDLPSRSWAARKRRGGGS